MGVDEFKTAWVKWETVVGGRLENRHRDNDVFLHLHPSHQSLLEFSRIEHRRDMLGFHPVKPNIVNVFVYVDGYVVDVHFFKISNSKNQSSILFFGDCCRSDYR